MFDGIEACPHINQVLNSKARDNVVVTYKQAIKLALLINSDNSFTLRKDNSPFPNSKLLALKLKALRCSSCKLNNFNKNLICLQCPNVGCQVNNHGYSHYKLNQHLFGIDSDNGLIFCFKCNNYISHKLLDRIRNQVVTFGDERDDDKENKDISATTNGEGGGDSDEDKEIYSLEHYDDPTDLSAKGLKGFINFGSTCFISSVLQTLVHNPLIKKRFFNNDNHYFNCTGRECVTCSIDRIFTEFFTSDNIDSFGMTNLLINSWYKNKSLTGFEEQDAHEFWQFLLNEFHKDYKRVELPSIKQERHKNSELRAIKNEEEEDGQDFHDDYDEDYCECITHQLFTGQLESSIKCSNCKNVTKTYDPFMDLSLELTNLTHKDSSIYDCLDLFTKDEVLENYKCQYCNKNSNPIKSFKINQTSNVLSIQLKRFKHDLSNFVKNDILINNPLYLNLSPYLSTNTNSHTTSRHYFYELFALICHTGNVNTGHYIVIIKNSNNQWLRFDDSVITLVSQDEIETTNAYLLFYIAHDV